MENCKKILCSLLSVLMLSSILPGTVIKAEAAVEGGTSSAAVSYDDYEKWKEDYVKTHKKSTTVSPNIRALIIPPDDGGPSNFMVSNNAIEFCVADTGEYTIGTTGGNPGTSTDDNKKLLYGHPYPGTSYTTIRLDGVSNVYTPNTYSPASSSEDLSNISVQKIGNIKITQELKIINNTSSSQADCVQIKYTVENNDNITHSLGTRIMMDTMLGSNDAAPFRIPGIGAVTSELELTGNNIPEYWQAFDSLSNPGVVSQGSFIPRPDVSNADKPDRVQFTNWARVYDTEWGYTVNPDRSNGDSAVSVIWDEKDIPADSTKEFVTYYGLSGLTQDTRPPLSVDLGGATNLQFDVKTCQYTPDPFTITSYIGNESSVTAENVKAKLILPDGLELDNSQSQNQEVNFGSIEAKDFSKMASWKVKVDPDKRSEEDRTLTYSVAVSEGTGTNINTKTVSRNVFIPAFKDPNSVDDDNEPINNTINGAVPIEKTGWWNVLYTWKDVTSKIHDSSDEDWYYVDVSDTDRYLYVGLEVDRKSKDDNTAKKNYDVDLYSFNNGVKKILAVTKSYYDVDDFRYKIDQPGRYYIRVYSNNGDFDTKLTYTLKTDLKYIFSQYGGEFQGWDYSGTKVDANYEVPIFLGSSVDGVKMKNPDDGKEYYLSDIIKGAVNIWNNADIKGRPTDYDGNYQKIFKFGDSGNKIYLFNKKGDKREDTTATAYCKQYGILDWFNIGINAEQFTLDAFSANSYSTNTDALTKSKQILAHEFGHALGLKDLYIYGSGGSSGYAKIDNSDKLMLGYWNVQDLSKNVGTLNEKDKEGVSLIQGWSQPEDYGYSLDASVASPENKITASASYEYISDTQLYNKSTIIVEGTVQNIANANDENADFPLSMIQFKADKYFKDLTKTNAPVLSVYQDGNKFVQFGENTLLEPGDRCILFLTPGSDGSYVMMGGPQARFDILKRNSEDVVINHMSNYIKRELQEQGQDSSEITYVPINEFEDTARDRVLKIPPTITGEALNKANENGWYNTDVTVHFSAEDLLYGLQSVTPDVILSTEGADQSVIGTAVNNRGTSASYTVRGINIDKTLPSIYEAINTRYYLGDKLKLDYTAEDKLSGLQSSGIYFDNQKYDAGSELILDKPGIHSIKITAEDRAGNINVITKNINVVIKFNLNITNKKIKLKNLDKKHFALKAFIDISEGYSANDVDLSSIMLDNRIKPVYSCGIHNNGSGGPADNDVLVLFSGPDLTDILVAGENTITITGKIGNIEFEASGIVNCEEK